MKDSKTFKSMNVNLGRFHCTQIWLGILLTEVSLNLRVLTLPCNTKCIDTDCWQAMHTIIMYNARKFKWLTFLQDILLNNNRYIIYILSYLENLWICQPGTTVQFSPAAIQSVFPVNHKPFIISAYINTDYLLKFVNANKQITIINSPVM